MVMSMGRDLVQIFIFWLKIEKRILIFQIMLVCPINYDPLNVAD